MTSKEKDYFHGLYDVAKAINSTLDFSQVLETIVKEVVESMGLKASSLRLLDRRGKRLLMGAAYGLSEDYIRKGAVEVNKSGIDKEVLAGKTVSIFDARTDPRFQYPEQAKKEGIRSVLVVPLMVEDRAIGVMRAYAAENREFSEDEVEFLNAVANLSAIAIENARLHQALKTEYEALATYERRMFDD